MECRSARFRKDVLSSNGAWFLAIAGLHIAVALCLKEIAGLDVAADVNRNYWDYFWQHLPMESLRTDLWRSIRHLHAQPPLFNLYGGMLGKLLGARYFQGLYFGNILLGGLLSGLTFFVARAVSRSLKFSVVVGVLLALNPALFLYEAHMLYDVLTVFLVALACSLLALHALRSRPVYLVLFVLVMNLLILCRSMFHLALLALLLPWVCLLAGRPWRSVLAASVAVSLVPAAWYAKNLTQFGFFGSSSWGGMNLWRVASAYHSPEDLAWLAERGVIHPVTAKVKAFEKPSAFVVHGFDRTSEVPVLALNNYNNVNIPEIAGLYRLSARRLIRHDPWRYLRNVGSAYCVFCRPSSKFRFLDANRHKIPWFEWIGSDILQGHHWLGGSLDAPERYPNSFLFFLLPAALALFVIGAVRAGGTSWARWVTGAREHSVLVFLAFLVCYVCLIGCAHELGENDRFKFSVESVLWVFVLGSLYRFGFVPLRGLWKRSRRETGRWFDEVSPPQPTGTKG